MVAAKSTTRTSSLAAEVISMNLDSSTVHAYGIKDTTGTIKGKPVFKEGETAYDTETISYNFKSKKAGITDIITQQGEGYVTGSRAKKEQMMKSLWSTVATRLVIIMTILTSTCSDKGQSAPQEECSDRTCLSCGGRCSPAVGCAVFLLPFLQQLFFGFHNADVYG